jgi:hypothetical protein
VWLWRERGPRALDLLLFRAVFVVWFIVPNVLQARTLDLGQHQGS